MTADTPVFSSGHIVSGQDITSGTQDIQFGSVAISTYVAPTSAHTDLAAGHGV
jgi:hypothetical protein